MKNLEAVDRKARWKASLETAGIRQLNILAPEAAHDALREIAARARAGEPLHTVLRSLAMRHANEAVRWGPLVVPDGLVPGPGESAIAVRMGKRSDGYTRKLMLQAGLVRSKDASAWVGVAPVALVEKLRKRAERLPGMRIAERHG